ncbi:hypothetical protein MUG87_01110 [Ectobacillus sp. JY-23]|uniref:hypothetical protein n=1 Tax=Ectobacillus sp. JY-23 TaxID=2933872 RepID=UPI001FF20F54|nr:hypothetical protein [Ectobacillus sp. JY-23]UOY92777.1 hypothetical protein MUG87_01110 [Ectobacillus sp. JY-23]
MKLLIIYAPMIASVVLYFITRYIKIKLLLDIVSYIALYTFGCILSLAIYDVLQKDVVFMTTIHKVLLNSYFLSAGAYLGVYLLYLLLHIIIRGIKENRAGE